MTLRRLDHLGIVVGDLAAATAFFVELGFEALGDGEVEGSWVERIIAVEGARVGYAMLGAPDGCGRLELVEFRAPPALQGDARAPANALGLRHVACVVEDLDDVLARLAGHGAELVGEVVRYGDVFRLCYLRGPEGIIVELAEELG